MMSIRRSKSTHQLIDPVGRLDPDARESSVRVGPLDHDEFGSNRFHFDLDVSIDRHRCHERDRFQRVRAGSQISLRNLRKLDCAGKPVSTFPHPALGSRCESIRQGAATSSATSCSARFFCTLSFELDEESRKGASFAPRSVAIARRGCSTGSRLVTERLEPSRETGSRPGASSETRPSICGSDSRRREPVASLLHREARLSWPSSLFIVRSPGP